MDIGIVRFFYEIDSKILGFLLKFFSLFGEAAFVVFFVAVIYLCIDKKFGERFAFNILFSVALNGLFKGIINRARPFETYFDIEPRNSFFGETHTGASFPSGHTQTASAFFYTLASLLKKWYFWVISTIIVVLVGVSRLYLGVHYFTDVLVGLILGLVIVFISNYIFDKLYEKKFYLYLALGLIMLGLTFLVKEKTIVDYIKTLGIYFGFVLGCFIENKYINIEVPKGKLKKALRMLVGGIIIAIIYFGLKLIPIDHVIYDGIRYFVVGLSCFTLVPFVLIKLKI